MAAKQVKRSTDLSSIPSDLSVNFLQGCDLTLKAKQQGFKYFNEGYFNDVGIFKDEENNVSVSAKCHRSQRKNEKPHSIHLDIGESHIPFAFCSCQAGMCGSCSHVVGLVQALTQWQLMGFTSIPADLSCTSLPQQWSKPRGPKIDPEPVANLIYVNPKLSRKKGPIQNQLHDNRNITVQVEDTDFLTTLNDTAFGYLVSTPGKTVQTHVGSVPIGSGLATHAAFYVETERRPVSTVCGDLVFPNLHQLITPQVSTLPPISLEDCIKIEERTRDQADSHLWLSERKKRITSSQFGLIIKRKVINSKFIATLKDPKQFTSAATSYGKSNERKAISEYMNSTGNHTHKSGLIINPMFPFLGATPDAKICEKGTSGILEVKCPFTARDMLINEACERKDFCLENINGEKKLKRSHCYYYQVQGQLLISGAPFCEFVVFTKKDMYVERIYPDPEFCQQMYNKLYDFYIHHFQDN